MSRKSRVGEVCFRGGSGHSYAAKWNSFRKLSQKDEEINILVQRATMVTHWTTNPTRRDGIARGVCVSLRQMAACQSPEPGFSEKNCSNLPSTPSISLASGIGSFFTVMFGQIFA